MASLATAAEQRQKAIMKVVRKREGKTLQEIADAITEKTGEAVSVKALTTPVGGLVREGLVARTERTKQSSARYRKA